MNTLAIPDCIFSGFKLATMVDPVVDFRCDVSGNSIPKSVQHVEYSAVEGVSIGVCAGRIVWLVMDDALPTFDLLPEQRIEGNSKWLTPGLIDCHTHLVYGGDRATEWEMRLNGVSYEDISRAGGGILSTVKSTRAASEDDLFDSASVRLGRIMSEGVTTIEIKSGYGLDVETELKMLRVANRLGEQFPVSVESTLLGAHALPPEFAGRANDYVDLVCNSMIPAAQGICSSVDAFCESIAFSRDQTRIVLEAALNAGLQIKVHAEQLTRTGAAVMAAEMGAISADHLEFLSDSDCAIMRTNGTVATLLPGAFYCLQETQKPPIEALRENQVPIAIATDCNPGSSPVVSLLLAGNMACNLFGMTPVESLAGMTRNAARALGLQNNRGTIEVGKRADFAVWDVRTPAELVYNLGLNPCVASYQGGRERRV